MGKIIIDLLLRRATILGHSLNDLGQKCGRPYAASFSFISKQQNKITTYQNICVNIFFFKSWSHLIRKGNSRDTLIRIARLLLGLSIGPNKNGKLFVYLWLHQNYRTTCLNVSANTEQNLSAMSSILCLCTEVHVIEYVWSRTHDKSFPFCFSSFLFVCIAPFRLTLKIHFIWTG